MQRFSKEKKKKALFSQLTFHFFNWINFCSRSFSSFFWMSVCFAFSCASHFSSGEFSFCFFSYRKKNFRKKLKHGQWNENSQPYRLNKKFSLEFPVDSLDQHTPAWSPESTMSETLWWQQRWEQYSTCKQV